MNRNAEKTGSKGNLSACSYFYEIGRILDFCGPVDYNGADTFLEVKLCPGHFTKGSTEN